MYRDLGRLDTCCKATLEERKWVPLKIRKFWPLFVGLASLSSGASSAVPGGDFAVSIASSPVLSEATSAATFGKCHFSPVSG